MYFYKTKDNSLLTHIFLTTVIVTLVLLSMSAHAIDADAIQFRGQIIDGPFKGQRVSEAWRDPNGNLYKQKSRCVLKTKGGYKIVDAKASLEVVGGFRAL